MILKLIFWYIIVVISITVCNGKKPNFLKNGIPTTIERYPFVVSIQWRNDHICTGNLISLNHVLTTAHCVLLESHHILSNFKIIAGTDDRLNEFGDEQVKDVAIIVYHRDYHPDRFWKNDLAILTLDSPIRVNNFTIPIIIRRNPGDMHSPIRSAGWGDPLISGAGQFFDNFQEILLIPAEPTDCRGFEDKITGALGCARILGNAYATLGDSGCPLVFHNQLIGIISKTILRQPNHIVYTDIFDYTGWILNNIF